MATEEIKNITKEEAEKDYKALCRLPLHKCIFSRRIGNKVNDYYTFPVRLNCRTKDGLTFREWAEIYKNKPYVQSLLQYHQDKLTEIQALYRAFQLYSRCGSIVAFKALVARWVCLTYKPKTILDFCAGWGGRALGALSADVNYIGYDTNIDLLEPYQRMFNECKSKARADVFFQDSSKADFSRHQYDMILTSPPFFISGKSSQEKYQHMPSYSSVDDFNNNFFIPVLKKAWAGLPANGWCLLNLPVSMAATAKKVLGDCDKVIPLGLSKRGKGKDYDEGIYCWQKKRNLPPATFINDLVEVRKSVIPNTDMWGLFAKTDIKKGQVIAPYQGVEMTLREFKERYGKDMRYVKSLRPINKHLVGKELPYLTLNPSHYANEAIESKLNIGFKRRCLVATRDITKDEELYLGYMKDYPRDYVLS